MQYTELPDNLLQATADYQEAPLLNPPATKRRDALQIAVAHPRSLPQTPSAYLQLGGRALLRLPRARWPALSIVLVVGRL